MSGVEQSIVGSEQGPDATASPSSNQIHVPDVDRLGPTSGLKNGDSMEITMEDDLLATPIITRHEGATFDLTTDGPCSIVADETEDQHDRLSAPVIIRYEACQFDLTTEGAYSISPGLNGDKATYPYREEASNEPNGTLQWQNPSWDPEDEPYNPERVFDHPPQTCNIRSGELLVSWENVAAVVGKSTNHLELIDVMKMNTKIGTDSMDANVKFHDKQAAWYIDHSHYQKVYWKKKSGLPAVAKFLTYLKVPAADNLDGAFNGACSFCGDHYRNDSGDREGEDPLQLPCGHIFGRSCLFIWFSDIGAPNNCCPLCRMHFAIPRCAPRAIFGDLGQLAADIDYLLLHMGPGDTYPGIIDHWKKTLKPCITRFAREQGTNISPAYSGIEAVIHKRNKFYLKQIAALQSFTDRETRWSLEEENAAVHRFLNPEPNPFEIDAEKAALEAARKQKRMVEFKDFLWAASKAGQMTRTREAEVRTFDPQLCDCNNDDVLVGRPPSKPCKNPVEHVWKSYRARIDESFAFLGDDLDEIDDGEWVWKGTLKIIHRYRPCTDVKKGLQIMELDD